MGKSFLGEVIETAVSMFSTGVCAVHGLSIILTHVRIILAPIALSPLFLSSKYWVSGCDIF